MFYIGHFSFDELGPGKEIRHGYFTCVIDADEAGTAADAFRELIISLKKKNDTFTNIITVYMEDIIEIQDLPQKAIITRIQSSTGEFPKSISTSLPHAVAPGINVYGYTPDIIEKETDRGTEEYKETRPFIKF
jgi:hypothetical protein